MLAEPLWRADGEVVAIRTMSDAALCDALQGLFGLWTSCQAALAEAACAAGDVPAQEWCLRLTPETALRWGDAAFEALRGEARRRGLVLPEVSAFLPLPGGDGLEFLPAAARLREVLERQGRPLTPGSAGAVLRARSRLVADGYPCLPDSWVAWQRLFGGFSLAGLELFDARQMDERIVDIGDARDRLVFARSGRGHLQHVCLADGRCLLLPAGADNPDSAKFSTPDFTAYMVALLDRILKASGIEAVPA